MKKHTRKQYARWILLVEAVGGLSGWLTHKGIRTYQKTIVQPPLSPPGTVFPIVWGGLFALMGIGAARIWASPPFRRPLPRSAALRDPADLQFLLEHPLLQFPGLRPGLTMAVGTVGTDSADDPLLPRGGFPRRPAADPVSSVGLLCRVPQRRRMAPQQALIPFPGRTKRPAS